MHLLVARDLL
ncbi:uncharacterized protein FFFS_00649 [Fusarium fujikuroi]|nr:uncharacterized protein FFFS_00649 [Fusarium fujikuroi]